jgi:hypothetical protein
MQINIGIAKEEFFEDGVWKREGVLAVSIRGFDTYGQPVDNYSFITKDDFKKWLDGGFDPSE